MNARESGLDPAKLENVKREPDGTIKAACPACRASGSDKSGDHLIIFASGKFACAANQGDSEHRKQIYALAAKDPPPSGNGAGTPKIVGTYDYPDRNGIFLYQVARLEPGYNGKRKDFFQRRRDESGRWINGLTEGDYYLNPKTDTWQKKPAPDAERKHFRAQTTVLFRLPELWRDIKKGLRVFLCEGEKDALAMAGRGFPATCNPMGAKKWENDYSETLRDCDVCIIADKDKDGRDHAQLVAGKLHGVAKTVRVIELPDTNRKPVKDAHDFFAAGGDPGEILHLAGEAPEWTPPAIAAPDAIPADIRGEIVSILTNSKLTPTEQRTQIANAVVSTLAGRGQFFSHTERKDFDSAMFFDGQRKELLRVRSDDFLAWLAEWLAVNKADPVFKYIAAQIETTALAGKQTKGILSESFWAARLGAIYMSNGNGRMAKITPGNVQLVDNGTDGVLFAAGNTLAEWELAEPKNPFETCSLFSGANCAAPHGHDLLRLWIFSLPTNPASKPPLCLAGDIGSGKTRLAKGIAELYGLPFVANKVEDFGEDSFWASLDAGGLFTLDNCDTRNKWLPDAVASAATDGCSQRRKLYTDCERITLRARAWLALTTANPTFAADSGLADRLILARMKRRTDETSDAALSDEIRQHRNAGLSFIARTLATALADTEKTPAGLNWRHPDFAAFAVRIGRATGRETESIHALKTAEDDKSLFCLENDSIAPALLLFLSNGETFTGTADELRQKLIEKDTELAALANNGKFSSKRLGKRLAALWPHLEKVLATAKQETGRGRLITYTLKSRPSGEFGEFQMPI